MDVRVSARVNVAEAPVDDFGAAEQLDVVRGHEVPGLSRLNHVPRPALHQHRKPADLEIGTGTEQDVRAAHLRDEARARPDVVRVLSAVGG